MNTNVEQVDGNSFLLNMEGADTVNHVVVFLTGQIPFAQGFGGSIYFGWPSVDTGTVSWQLLGYISNDKPSAIFKLTKVKPAESVNPFSQELMETFNARPSTIAQIGIVVESFAEITQKTPSLNTEPSTVNNFTEFSQKMLENFFNFASSFSVVPNVSGIDASRTYVPMEVLEKWYSTFQRRLQANPQFWKTL